MNNIAVILGRTAVSWSGILLALAALCTILTALALRCRQGRPVQPMGWLLLAVLLLSLPLARLVHWYCNAPQYSSFGAAMTDYSRGGYSLVGVYFALAIVLTAARLTELVPDTLSVLDCLAPAGALGLGVGRLSCLFTVTDRSKFTLEGEQFRRLPFMISSVNAAGTEEWRIATFCFEAITAFIIAAVLLRLFERLTTRERLRGEWREGNVFFLFLALYGAVEVVLDSTRYDALYLRSNGFVSVVQIICVVGLIVSMVLYSIRSVSTNGRCGWHFVLWALFLLGAGVGGYMEYYVQRHGNLFLFCYSIMGTMFLLCFGVTARLQYTCGAETPDASGTVDDDECPEDAEYSLELAQETAEELTEESVLESEFKLDFTDRMRGTAEYIDYADIDELLAAAEEPAQERRERPTRPRTRTSRRGGSHSAR